jgi:hypothetical protein
MGDDALRKYVALFALFACTSAFAAAPAKQEGHAADARNMRLLGAHDLQGRTAFETAIIKQGDRWISYVGHFGGKKLNPLTGQVEANGTSILDVTDPKKPKYLHHIPSNSGELVADGAGSGAQMVKVCAGRDLPKGDRNKFYMLRAAGSSIHEMWDVTNPEQPQRLATVSDKLRTTHEQWWECDTGIAYIVSGVPEWRIRRMTQVYDLSDPANPVFIRNFGLVGQEPTAPKPANPRFHDGHGAFSTGPQGNRLYFGYGNLGDGALQIVDRKKLLEGPKEPTPENLKYPEVSFLRIGRWQAIHAVYPLIGVDIPAFAPYAKGRVRDFVIVMPEAIENECKEEPQMLFVVDVTNETEPFGVSNFRVPEKPGNFCSRGARFGPHAAQTNLTPIYHKRIVFVAWFNAGLRAIDVRDPYALKEIGHYIPATNKNTHPSCPGGERGIVAGHQETNCKTAIVTNAVEVDDRGYVYMVDRNNTGMHIVELSGPARKLANFK